MFFNVIFIGIALPPKRHHYGIFDTLLQEVSGELTKNAAATLALKAFVARREQRNVAELFGKFEWDDSFDYKSERSRS
jgi:hypothetical protein